jgi:1,4-alpha-glucan branching enzyme
MDRLIALSLTLCSCAVFVPAERTEADRMEFHYPAAARVQLVGDWNNWGGAATVTGLPDPSCGTMENRDGTWFATVPEDLERGRYRYAFLVNGTQYFPDPMNPERAEFGGHMVSVFLID